MALNETSQQKSTKKVEDKIFVEPLKPLDGGWGWLIVVGSFVINFISDGIVCSFGVIYVQLLDEFNEGKGYTSWILSLMSGMALCVGPISSTFVNKYGFRAVTISGSILAAVSLFASYYAQNVFTLIITIGFMLGSGLGLVYLPAIVSVTTYFEKYRSVAVGIAMAGSGLGTFVFAPLVDFLNEEYGWRGTLMVMSGIVLNCAIFGVLFRPLASFNEENSLSEHSDSFESKRNCDAESHRSSHHEHGHLKSEQIPLPQSNNSCTNMSIKVYKNFVKMMNLGLLKDPIFVLFTVSDFATSLVYYVPYFIIIDQATELGVRKDQATHLVSIIGIFNTLGRIMWGYISDKPFVNRLWVYNICLTICGLATIASVFCFDFKTLAIFSAVFGFTIGAYVALRSVILVDLLGLEKLNNAFGLLMLFEGLATFMGAPLVGFLYDISNSYTPGFLLAGTMIALSGFILFFLPLLQKHTSKHNPDLEMT
ncbi:monocarboxylate transporter 9-like [Sitodiplosis mosellana]|uniref:monocarboxylate transporter 9-like n=1 Tax=Sitodiplosis mosellana TaxID=263140 RepID=UPI0024445B0C|nr:monocarboxylate transporter 9-like [Sitodiplosis mosellana]